MVSRSMAMLWLYATLFGLSMGGSTLRPLLPTWLFGLSSLGTLQGVAQMACAMGSAVGPFFAGYIFDLSGSYHAAFGVFALACVLGLVSVSLARPVPVPQEVS